MREPKQPMSPIELEKPLCEEKNCRAETDGPDTDYCEEHHAHYFCECGQALGEYAGEGMCKNCQ
ncbi:MAG: hypothetical protein ACXWQO_07950 [Bdellovibrionota bacterium]